MYLRSRKFAILVSALLAGCFEKDIAIEPTSRLNKTVVLDAGESKQMTNYYSLEEDTLLAQINPMTWDIEYSEGVLTINGFRSMQAARSEKVWVDLKDTVGLEFKFLTVDYSKSMWSLQEDQVYVLEMGFDEEYRSLGYYKFWYHLKDNKVLLKFAKLEGSNFTELELVESDFHYSLLNQEFIEVPFAYQYDIAFGKYTDYVIFPDEQTDYLVTGVLLGDAQAVKLNAHFESVYTSTIDTLSFTSMLKTTVGWDWKYYNLSAGAYTMRENQIFIIKAKEDFYYKLRFVDFYNNEGISGHTSFEYTLL
jgi:hypothetical protein